LQSSSFISNDAQQQEVNMIQREQTVRSGIGDASGFAGQSVPVVHPVCVEGAALKQWLQEHLTSLIGADAQLYLVPRTFEAKGESRFFCCVNVDEAISVEELARREVTEHARGPHHYFHADDVLAAAQGEGAVSGGWYWLYYTW
jgi:hypothetical protein